MNRMRWMAIGACALLAATSAGAGVDIDFGASVPFGDDGRLYLAISSRYFGVPAEHVRHLALRYSDPDDLAVGLFIGQRTGRSPELILDLHRSGVSWWDVAVRCGVAEEAWFVPVKGRPGPPYGKAYGHWKKHRADRRHALRLSDADLRHLVAVRVLHEYYAIPVEQAMERRARGSDLRALLGAEYRRRHAPGEHRTRR